MLEGLNLNLEIRIRISVERRISSGRLKQFRGILRSCGASFMVWCRNNLVRYALAKESSENKSVGESLSNLLEQYSLANRQSSLHSSKNLSVQIILSFIV